MNRAKSLTQGAAGGRGGAGGRRTSGTRATRRQRNILFLRADEMRGDAMSSEKHPVVSTPNLDRLAGQGVRFANAYTAAPVCSPARASIFTGRYADVHGVTSNGAPANHGEIFLPSILKHSGYHTALAGKLRMASIDLDLYQRRSGARSRLHELPPAQAWLAGEVADYSRHVSAPERSNCTTCGTTRRRSAILPMMRSIRV